jgi:hypothetical protein
VVGALATVPLPAEMPPLPDAAPRADEASVVRTGFAALDALLGLGGVPRQAGLALRGDHSSGKTTLAMRLVAEAQAAGSIAAWLDLSRSLDPVEAVARGVRLEWLVVLTPDSLDEGLAMAGSLVQGRAVDLLVVDLGAGLPSEGAGVARRTPVGKPTGLPSEGAGVARRTPSVADRLRRLAGIARVTGVLLVVLEPPGLPGAMTGALAEVAGLRLEVARRTWIRLGRDVVGQRMEVTVARNRFGPSGRRADLRILYADGGTRDRCLGRDPLLSEAPATTEAPVHPFVETTSHAPPPSPLVAPPPPSRPVALHVVPVDDRVARRPDRPRRPAVDAGNGPRREPGRDGPGRPARAAAGDRTPAGA